MSKYFSPNERGLDNGRYEKLDPLLLEKLDQLREEYGKAIIITSSYRGADHPIEAAKPNGPGTHSYGIAVDIASVGGNTTLELVTAAIKVGFKRIGINRKNNFIHLDLADRTHGRSPSLWHY